MNKLKVNSYLYSHVPSDDREPELVTIILEVIRYMYIQLLAMHQSAGASSLRSEHAHF